MNRRSMILAVVATSGLALVAAATPDSPVAAATPASPVAAPAVSPPVAETIAPAPNAGDDPGRTGSTQDLGPERPPAIVWSRLVTANVVTEPIMATVAGRDVVLVGSGEDVLAIAARGGEPLWTNPLGMLVGAAPSIAGGHVIAHGLDGILRLIDAKTGKTFKDIENDFLLESRGLLLGDLYVYEETGHGGAQAKSRLHAMSLTTRMDLWRANYVMGTGRAPSTDAVRVFVAGSDAVRAFLLSDGSEAWTYPFPVASRVYEPVVSDGRVIVTRGGYGAGTIEALDAATGKLLWTRQAEARLAAAPSLAGDEIFLPLMNSTLARFKAADGAVLTAVKMPGRVDTRLVVAPHRIYFAAGKTFGALDRATLQPAWRLDVDGEIASITVAGGMLLVARQDGFLNAVESAAAP